MFHACKNKALQNKKQLPKTRIFRMRVFQSFAKMCVKRLGKLVAKLAEHIGEQDLLAIFKINLVPRKATASVGDNLAQVDAPRLGCAAHVKNRTALHGGRSHNEIHLVGSDVEMSIP